MIGNSLLRLTLESFLFWGTIYKENLVGSGESVFLKYYNDLVNLNIKFPEKINYFRN